MYSQLRQISTWMAAQHRLTRTTPVSTLRAIERIDAVTFIQDALNTFGRSLNTQLSHDIVTAKSEGDHFIYPQSYEALTRLLAEVIAAAHTLGVAHALEGGIYQLTGSTLPPSAHSPRFFPSTITYSTILNQAYGFPPNHSFD